MVKDNEPLGPSTLPPVSTETAPPVLDEPSAAPPAILTDPPSPPMLLPPSIVTEPAAPPEDEPELIRTDPEEPSEAKPLSTLISPLALPSAVESAREPLTAPAPLETRTFPPVAAVSEVLPALTTTAPPGPTSLVPTSTTMAPLEPPVAFPDFTTMPPLSPVLVPPVDRST